MKKTILRSLIVGLFAVVATGAYANYVPYGGYNEFSVNGYWMEANSCYEFTAGVDPLQIQGDSLRVCWNLSLYEGLINGDYIEVGTNFCNSNDNFIAFVGTHATCTAKIPYNPDGTFTVRIFTGPYSGYRSISNLFYWNTFYEWVSGGFYWDVTY